MRFCCKFGSKAAGGAGKLLAHFDPAKSEAENMKANGYRRIFDCGNMVFEKLY